MWPAVPGQAVPTAEVLLCDGAVGTCAQLVGHSRTSKTAVMHKCLLSELFTYQPLSPLMLVSPLEKVHTMLYRVKES